MMSDIAHHTRPLSLFRSALFVALVLSPLTHGADLNGDGTDDLLTRNTEDGTWTLFELAANRLSAVRSPDLPANLRWQHQATADFDGDGDGDYLLRRDDGQWQIYQTQEGAIVTSSRLNLFTNNDWQFQFAADMDGDGDADIVLRQQSTGAWRRFTLQNLSSVATAGLRIFRNSAWQLISTGDLDGDGDHDILLRSAINNRWMVFAVQNGNVISQAPPGRLFLGADWQHAGTGRFGESTTHGVLLRNVASGAWRAFPFANLRASALLRFAAPANPELAPVYVGDSNADGDADVLLRDQSTGAWTLIDIDNFAPTSTLTPGIWQNDDLIVQTADFLDEINIGSGPQDVDVLVENSTNGRWHTYLADQFRLTLQSSIDLGGDDVAAVADFDGDRDADLLTRASSGAWQLATLQRGRLVSSQPASLFQNNVWQIRGAGDYDGDGDADALLRNTSGDWLIFRFENGQVAGAPVTPALFTSSVWQFVAIRDFDGDGDADVLLRHTGNGTWRMFAFQNGIAASSTVALPTSLAWAYAGAGDLDADGDLDILLRNTTNAQWRAARMQSLDRAGYVSVSGLWSNAALTLQFIGDLDRDGDDDIVLRHSNGTWNAFEMQNFAAQSVRNPGLPSNAALSFSAAANLDLEPRFAVSLRASSTTGLIPFDVDFEAVVEGGTAPYQFAWDTNGDGETDDTRAAFRLSFGNFGDVPIQVRVTDGAGRVGTAQVTIDAHSAPIVIPSATPLQGLPPEQVNFDATVNDFDGTVVRYDWDFDGDGRIDFTSTDGPAASFTYDGRGRYTALLTVTDNDLRSTTETVVVLMGTPPPVSLTSDTNQGVAPLPISYNVQIGTHDRDIVLYEWDFDGDGRIDFTSDSSPAATFTQNNGGVFRTVVRVTDSDGLTTEEAVVVDVQAPPESLPGAYPLQGPAPLTVTFFSDADDSDGSPEFYEWDFDGDGSFERRLIASQNTTYTFDSAGTYPVTLRVTDNEGLTADGVVTITVTDETGNSASFPSAVVTANPAIGGAPLDTLLSGFATDPDGNIVSVEWDFESDGVYDLTETVNPAQLLAEVIDVGSYANIAFLDMDGDGDDDLVIGNSAGQLLHYENRGSNAYVTTQFVDYLNDVLGTRIDLGSYAAPYAYDVDGDGDLDLVVGNSSGRFFTIQNTATTADPVWVVSDEYLNSTGSVLDIGSYSVPEVFDHNADGDWDMLVGTSVGEIRLVENTGTNAAPQWVDQGPIADAGGNVIDVGSYAVPHFYDIDGDGVPDLYVGNSTGLIFPLANSGTAAVPIFTVGTNLVLEDGTTAIDIGSYATPIVTPIAGGEALWVGDSGGRITLFERPSRADAWQLVADDFETLDVGSYSVPAEFDLDNDGTWDLLIGTQQGTIFEARNLGTNTAPVLRLGAPIEDANGVIDVGSYANLQPLDIDGDGDLDLLVGNSSGLIHLLENTGAPGAAIWNSRGEQTYADGTLIDVGSYAAPRTYDADRDGDLDLYVGNSSGTLTWLTNTGTNTAPVWEDGGLVASTTADTLDVGSYAIPAFADIDEDGSPNLLVGNSSGQILHYVLDNPGTANVWRLTNAQWGEADIGSYAAPLPLRLEDDDDIDLLVGSSSGLLYQVRTVGIVRFVSSTQGTQTLTFRATDNDGNSTETTLDITVLPPGSPSLFLRATPPAGAAPLNVAFSAEVGADDVIDRYEWDFDGDGSIDRTGSATETFTYVQAGQYNATVTAVATNGQSATVSTPVQVSFALQSTSDAVFSGSQSGSIRSALGTEATVTLRIVDDRGNVVATLVDGELRTAGSYTDTWNPGDLADGTYYYVYELSGNGLTQVFDLRETATFEEYTPARTWPSSFNPYIGVPLETTFTVNKPSEVSLYFWTRDTSRGASSIAPVRTLMTREFRPAGTVTEIWDGVDDTDVPVTPGQQYPITLWVYELADNAITVRQSRPTISNIAATNRVFRPSYNPYSATGTQGVQVTFELSSPGDVEVTVFNADGAVVNQFFDNNLVAGANSVRWGGVDFDGNYVSPGIYTVRLVGVDPSGRRSLPRHAIVTARY